MEATDNKKIVAPVNDCGHVTFLPLNDLEAWRAELQKGDVCVCIIECIQGVGGIRLVEPDFYRGLRRLCTETGTVLICDEIQCGYGRSGRFFAHQHLFRPEERAAMAPDLITVAKGIANGFPMGALLVGPQFEAVYGQLGTTFGGNHMACAAALAVLDVMEKEHLVENARRVGDFLMQEIRGLGSPKITDVRGRGLMIGIELDEPYREIRNRLLTEQHCFTGCAGTNTLRLLPPLCLTQQEAAQFVEKLRAVL